MSMATEISIVLLNAVRAAQDMKSLCRRDATIPPALVCLKFTSANETGD